MKNFICLSLLLVSTFLVAQRESPIEDQFPTESVDLRNRGGQPKGPKRKNISLLYVGSADNILYGNACATYETHRMGFEYIVEPPNGLESKTRLGKRLNNLWVKTKLVVTRSPFWKLVLNNRIKKCRRQTGDFVG